MSAINVTAEGRDHRNRNTRDTQKSYEKQQHDEHYRTDRYRAKDSDSHRDHSSNYRPHKPNVWYNTRSRYESNYGPIMNMTLETIDTETEITDIVRIMTRIMIEIIHR